MELSRREIEEVVTNSSPLTIYSLLLLGVWSPSPAWILVVVTITQVILLSVSIQFVYNNHYVAPYLIDVRYILWMVNCVQKRLVFLQLLMGYFYCCPTCLLS